MYRHPVVVFSFFDYIRVISRFPRISGFRDFDPDSPAVLHTLKQQEVKAEESSLHLSAQTRAFTAAPEARKQASNARARARTCATVHTLLSVYLVFHGCPKTMREEAQ